MKKLTKLILALLTISLCLNGCKKNDTIVNSNQSTDKQMIDQFTKVPKGLKPALQKIADKLKEKDAQTPFIVKVSSRAGLPLWSKAQFKEKHTNNAAAREMLEGEQSVLIPLSIASSSEVDGFMAAVIDANGDVKSVSEYDKFNYYTLGFNKPDTEIDAEDVAMQILILQKEVFGNAKFKILDNKLFNSQDGSAAARKIFEISISETQLPPQTSSRVIIVKQNHCTGHSGTGPNGHEGGDCDECDDCGVFEYTIVFFDSPFDWGSSGGTGGGSGSGGGGGGSGWVPPPPTILTIYNIWQNMGLTSYQQSFIDDPANQTIINRLAILMSNENFSKDAKNATRAVMDAMHYGEINGPYTNQAFLNIITDLSTESVIVGSDNYWETFQYHKNEIAQNNSSNQDFENYWSATFETNAIFAMDNRNDDDPSSYDLNNLDNNVYTPYNFQSPTNVWPYIAKVTPNSSFVPYIRDTDGYDCFGAAKKRLAKMGYKIPDYNKPPNQTITCYKRKKNSNGKFVEGDYNDANVKTGVDYLLKALALGKPVMVGVECSDRLNQGHLLSDNTTDHWLIINGSGVDANGPFFTYEETNTSDMNNSYIDPKTQQPYKIRFVQGEGLITDCITPGCNWGKKVTQIRKTKP